jgi:hypothetical protein
MLSTYCGFIETFNLPSASLLTLEIVPELRTGEVLYHVVPRGFLVVFAEVGDDLAREDFNRRGLSDAVRADYTHNPRLLGAREPEECETVHAVLVHHPLLHFVRKRYYLDRLERALVNAYAAAHAELLGYHGSTVFAHHNGLGPGSHWWTVVLAFIDAFLRLTALPDEHGDTHDGLIAQIDKKGIGARHRDKQSF